MCSYFLITFGFLDMYIKYFDTNYFIRQICIQYKYEYTSIILYITPYFAIANTASNTCT